MTAVVEDEGALAETRAFNAELERTLAEGPPMQTLPVEDVRQARREGIDIFPPPEYLTVDTPPPPEPAPPAPEPEPAPPPLPAPPRAGPFAIERFTIDLSYDGRRLQTVVRFPTDRGAGPFHQVEIKMQIVQREQRTADDFASDRDVPQVGA